MAKLLARDSRAIRAYTTQTSLPYPDMIKFTDQARAEPDPNNSWYDQDDLAALAELAHGRHGCDARHLSSGS